jgi:hypothetical protein
MNAPHYLSQVAGKLHMRGYAINWHKGHHEMTASKLGIKTRYSCYACLVRVSGPEIDGFP